MKQLQFDSSNKAITPLGTYRLEKDYESHAIYLVYPDGTSKKGTDPKTLKVYAEQHYVQTVLACLEQPLVALFSSPGRWRESTMKHDRLISKGELTNIKYTLNEAVALCYFSNQKEILDLIREKVGEVCVFNNQGRLAVLELVGDLGL